MGKNVAPGLSKTSKKYGRKTLLLVGRDGNVKHVGWFRGLFVFCLLLLAVSIGAAGFFYYLYQQALLEIQMGRNALVESERRARNFADERKQYKERMLFAEAKLNHREENGKTTGKAVDKTKKSAPVEKPAEESGENNKNGSDAKDTQQVDNSDETVNNLASVIPSPVDADDLQVKKRGNKIRLEFNLKNVSPDSRPVSGHTVAVLKTNGASRNWLAMPEEVDLVSGKPDGAQTGERFRISRFKTINLAARYDNMNPKKFKIATVYIFDGEGVLLLEKDFSIAIE